VRTIRRGLYSGAVRPAAARRDLAARSQYDLGKIVAGIGDFFMRFQNRACALLERESFPGTAVEMLPDWERALGLPDPWITDALTRPAPGGLRRAPGGRDDPRAAGHDRQQP
jgi:hypothetical protein